MGACEGRIKRLHWEYGKEMKISEQRRQIMLASLALNVVLIFAVAFS